MTRNEAQIRSLSRGLVDRAMRPEVAFDSKSFGISVISVGMLAVVDQNSGYFGKVLTPEEYSYCSRFPSDKANKFAGRVAGKTAVRQVLGQDVPLSDIVILSQDFGWPPKVSFQNQAEVCAASQRITNVAVSISHDAGVALAFAIPQMENSPEVRVGVDITALPNLYKDDEKRKVRMAKRILGPGEYDEQITAEALGEKWAIKEAVMKALGTGNKLGVHFKDIETFVQPTGAIEIQLSGEAAVRAKNRDLKNWNIAAENLNGYACAFVVVS